MRRSRRVGTGVSLSPSLVTAAEMARARRATDKDDAAACQAPLVQCPRSRAEVKMKGNVDVERIRARLIEAEQGGFTSLSPEQIRTEIRREMRRDKELLEPTPKLATALKKLRPLPSDESLPDVDEGQLPLDRNPLG